MNLLEKKSMKDFPQTKNMKRLSVKSNKTYYFRKKIKIKQVILFNFRKIVKEIKANYIKVKRTKSIWLKNKNLKLFRKKWSFMMQKKKKDSFKINFII